MGLKEHPSPIEEGAKNRSRKCSRRWWLSEVDQHGREQPLPGSSREHLTRMSHRKQPLQCRAAAAPHPLDAIIVFTSVIALIAPLTSATPKAIDLHDLAQLEAHSPNYCNDTKACDDAGLLRSPLGQFLGYPCSAEFFHCRWQSDGYRTYKKLCRTGLVYDVMGTQNCNYDYAVDGCNEKKPEKCSAEDFACPLSEKCVKMSQRCDGKYDCMLEEDEQNCPMCKPKEFPCIVSEQCIPISGRCNGIKECEDGSDEQNCDVCGKGQFFCRKSEKCIPGKQRCDGKAQCPAGEDEMLCKKTAFRMYVCENGIRVPRDRVCDGTKHCPDGSDEKYCNKPMMPIVKGIFGNDGAADDQSGQATDQPKVSASFPLVEFHGAPDSSSSGSPEKTVEASVTAAPAAQADESQTTTTAAAESTAAQQTTVAVEVPAATEETTEAPSEAATEAAAAEEDAAQPTETEATTAEAAVATDAEATTVDTVTEAAETEEPSTVATVAHHAKMKKYPFVNPWAKTPLPAGLTLPPAALNGTTASAPSTTGAPTTTLTTTTRCPHSYTVAILASGYGSSVAACPTEEPASAVSDDIPEYVGQSGRKQFIPAYTSTDATPPPASPALEASVDEALMKILSAKYGGNSKDLLKKIERMLKADKTTTPQPVEQTNHARAFYRHLPSQTIRVTGRPAHKWKPSLSSDVSRTTLRPPVYHSVVTRRSSSKRRSQEGRRKKSTSVRKQESTTPVSHANLP